MKIQQTKVILLISQKKTGFDNKLKDVTANKNEINELSKKFKGISTKGLTKDLINKFSILNEAKYFYLGIFQNYLVFIAAKSDTTQPQKPHGMLEESIENITKSDSNFAPTFVDHYLFPDMNIMDV